MQLNFFGGSGKTTKMLLTGGNDACILHLLIPDSHQEHKRCLTGLYSNPTLWYCVEYS